MTLNMKAKKLLAIVASVCLLLVMVPVFTLLASADDVPIPAKKDGSTNYGATVVLNANKGAAVDNGDGSYTITGDGYTGAPGNLTLDLAGLSATSDYVMSFNIVMDAASWGSANQATKIFLSDSTTADYFFLNKNTPYWYDATGTQGTYTAPTLADKNLASVTIYADYDATAATRTYHVFVGGVLVASKAGNVADPMLKIVAPREKYNATVSNIDVYDPNELVLQGETDWARDDSTAVTVTNGEATAVYNYETGAITWKHKDTGKLTLNPAGLNDEFVVSFSMQWATGGWTGAGYKFQLAGQDIATVRKNHTNNALTADVALDNGPTDFWFHVYPNADDASLSDVDVVIGTFKKTVTGLSLGKNPTVAMQQMAQVWGDTTTFTNWSIRNVDKDPYIAKIPARPETSINWATDERTVVTLTNSSNAYDAANGSVAWNHKGTGKFEFAAPGLNNDFALTFNMTLGGGWEGNGHYLQVGGQNIFLIRKNHDSNTIADADYSQTQGAAVAYVIHVYPNADDATLSDVDVFVNGVCLKTVTGLTLGKNPTIGIQQYAQQWGDTTTITDIDLFNVNGIDPYIYVEGDYDRPETNINWATNSETEWITSNINGSSVLDQAAGSAYLQHTDAVQTIDFDLPEGALSDDFVVAFQLSSVSGWNGDWKLVEFKLSEAGTFEFVISKNIVSVNGEIVVADGAVTGTGHSVWNSVVSGYAPFTVTIHVDYIDEDTAYATIRLGGTSIGSYEVDMTNPCLRLIDRQSQWDGRCTVSNLDIYNVGADTYVPAPETPTYDVTVEAVGGTVTGAPTEKVEYGTAATLTATANEGYTFKYWIVNDRVYLDETITLTVKGDTAVKAVFAADEVAEDYDPTVTFLTKDGRVVATLKKSELIGGAELPAVPARYGFTGAEWEAIVVEEIEVDTEVYAIYFKEDVTYTITVTGGDVSKKTAHFDEAIVLTATIEGFKAWEINGVIASTDAEYRCFVTGDMTIVAVTDEVNASAAAVRVDGMNVAGGKFSMVSIGSVYVADGYTFVEAGIVYSVANSNPEIGATGVGKKVSSIREAGQFMYVLNGAPAENVIYVRSYVITKDAEGNLNTTYSAVSSYTA